MIINKIRLTEFIFVIIFKILLINSCRVRQNNISKVDDYFSLEEFVNENEEENEKEKEDEVITYSCTRVFA